MTAEQRIAAQLREWSLEGDAAALAGLVERVEAALSGGPTVATELAVLPAPPVSDPLGDSSPWVWKSSDIPRATPLGGGPRAQRPLQDWRVAVKDLIAVAGQPLRAGSAARFDAAAESRDAVAVSQVRDAGAVLVGTTKLHEFAFGTTGINAASSTVANPGAPGRIPGGSSSGAAAVIALGEADLALGTDTGGSVRIPAALCGVLGFKPSYGAISTTGVFPLAPSLDHVGFLVASAKQLLAPATVFGLYDHNVGRPSGSWLKVGVARGAAELADDTVREAFEVALERLRWAGVLPTEVNWPMGEEVFAATTAIMFAEAADGHRDRLRTRAHLYGSDVRNRLLQGSAVTLRTYLAAGAARDEIRQRCRAVLSSGIDVVLTPTVPVVAPELAAATDPAVGSTLVTFTRLANLTGLPAVSLPIHAAGLPVGLQLEGATDQTVIEAALAVAAILQPG